MRFALVLCAWLAGCGGDDDGSAGDLGVRLSPSGTVYTNAALVLEVAVTGAPDHVALLLDSEPLDELSPPYATSWDTTAADEGSHTIVARAARGDETVDSEPLEVVVDRTAPTATSWLPGEGAQPGDPIRVGFSEPVLVAGALDLTVTVEGEALTTGEPVLSDGQLELAVELDEAPPVPSTVEVVLTGGVTDRAGNELTDLSWSYRLSYWTTLVPATALGNLGTDFALDGTDRPVLIWRTADQGPFVSRWDGQAWEELAGGAIEGRVMPPQPSAMAVVIDGAGAPVVAFEDDPTRTLDQDLYVARWDGATWVMLGDGPLDVAPTASTRGMSLVLGPDGAPTIAWAEDRASPAFGSELHVRRWDGAAWQDVATALDALGLAEARGQAPPTLAHDMDGTPWLSWSEHGGPGLKHVGHVARWDAADSAWVVLDPVTHDESLETSVVGLAIDPAGRAVVAFGEVGHTVQGFVWRSLADGGWEQLGETLGDDPPGSPSALVIDRVGRPVVAIGVVGEVHRVLVARLDDGRWEPLGPVVNERYEEEVLTPDLALDSTGRVVVGLGERTPAEGQNRRFVLRRSDVGDEPPYGLQDIPTSTCRIDAVPAALVSDTGCYEDAAARTPAPGLIPYAIRSPLWSDGAYKRRYMVLPEGSTIGFTPTGAWQMPDGAILVKEFLVGDERRPVETRFLVHRDQDDWEGFSYAWNEDGTDAVLLPPESSTREWSIQDGGELRAHTHYYPSRDECLRCHNAVAGRVLGLQTPQLNRWIDYGVVGGVVDDQLRTLEHLGLFGGPIGADAPEAFERIASPHDLGQSLESRVRGYLHVNCAQCHLPGGEWEIMDLRFETPLADSWLCYDLTVGSAASSAIWTRDAARGTADQMPPLATLVPDESWLALLGSWIDGLTSCP